MLPEEDFRFIVENTPLISVDLVISSEEENWGESILMGLRKNPPGKDFWFVPGGRIFKDETIVQATKRILQEEVKLDSESLFPYIMGIFEHHYPDNFLGNDKFSTHYVVIAKRLHLPKLDIDELPLEEHSEWAWIEDENSKENIHDFSASYFMAGFPDYLK